MCQALRKYIHIDPAIMQSNYNFKSNISQYFIAKYYKSVNYFLSSLYIFFSLELKWESQPLNPCEQQHCHGDTEKHKLHLSRFDQLCESKLKTKYIYTQLI